VLKGYETAVNYVAFSTDSSRIGGGAHVKTKHLGRVTESTARLSVAIGVDSWLCGPPKTSPTETRVCTRSARKGIQLPAIFEPGKGANQGAAAGIRLSKTLVFWKRTAGAHVQNSREVFSPINSFRKSKYRNLVGTRVFVTGSSGAE
jgi:hypothetical protein